MVRLVLRLAHGQCRTEPAVCVHRLRKRWSRRLTPRNVDGMFAAVAGILLGLAISFGPLISWDARLSIVGEQMIAAFSAGTQALLLKIPVVQDTPDVVETFSAIVAIAAPGVIALLLVVGAKKMKTFRRSLSGVLVFGAAASFLVLPVSHSAALLIAAMVVSGVLLVPAGWLSQVALWAAATLIAADNVLTVWDSDSEVVAAGAAAFARVSGMDAPELWRFATLLLALAPFAMALFSDIKPSKSSS